MREEWPTAQQNTLDEEEGVLLDRFLYSQASTKQSHQLREQKSVRSEERYEALFLEPEKANLKLGFLTVMSPISDCGYVNMEFQVRLPYIVNTSFNQGLL